VLKQHRERRDDLARVRVRVRVKLRVRDRVGVRVGVGVGVRVRRGDDCADAVGEDTEGSGGEAAGLVLGGHHLTSATARGRVLEEVRYSG